MWICSGCGVPSPSVLRQIIATIITPNTTGKWPAIFFRKPVSFLHNFYSSFTRTRITLVDLYLLICLAILLWVSSSRIWTVSRWLTVNGIFLIVAGTAWQNQGEEIRQFREYSPPGNFEIKTRWNAISSVILGCICDILIALLISWHFAHCVNEKKHFWRDDNKNL